MKRFLVLVALLALVAPAAFAAPPTGKGKPETKEPSTPEQSTNNAAKACKAERKQLGVDSFDKKYGTNHNLRNAFGKCVSGKSNDTSNAIQTSTQSFTSSGKA